MFGSTPSAPARRNRLTSPSEKRLKPGVVVSLRGRSAAAPNTVRRAWIAASSSSRAGAPGSGGRNA